MIVKKWLPRWLSGKESACQGRRCKRCRFDLWVGKIPWRRKWQPSPVFLHGKSHGQRSLVGYSPWHHRESDTAERLNSSSSCRNSLLSQPNKSQTPEGAGNRPSTAGAHPLEETLGFPRVQVMDSAWPLFYIESLSGHLAFCSSISSSGKWEGWAGAVLLNTGCRTELLGTL